MRLNISNNSTFRCALHVALILLIVGSCCKPEHKDSPALLIRGGTIIDVSNRGKLDNDLAHSYILIRGDTIAAIGRLDDNTELPKDAVVIDASGKFIIPGLFDGFAVINNQEYANAFLYMGVTSIIGVDGGRRGSFFTEADPSPDFYRLESVGDERKPVEEHIADLESLYEKGYSIALLKYALSPDQVQKLKARAEELGMGCIGELGYTTYREATELGIEVFVHTTRYSLDVAPVNLAKGVADQPFSDDMESPKWKYYRYLSNLDLDDPELENHASMLASSGTFLMPTLSLLYLDLPDHENPWDYAIASILSEEDINNPADKETGNHHYEPFIQENYRNLAIHELEIEKLYAAKGARYLAGSATDVWGTMPGISLHTELHLLSEIGLSNREVLAAATSNFNEAFGWKTGCITKGYCANLLVLTGNPLDDLDNLEKIEHLILKGKIIDRSSLLHSINE